MDNRTVKFMALAVQNMAKHAAATGKRPSLTYEWGCDDCGAKNLEDRVPETSDLRCQSCGCSYKNGGEVNPHTCYYQVAGTCHKRADKPDCRAYNCPLVWNL